jgi:TRAP transporter TAXI family solute receptor
MGRTGRVLAVVVLACALLAGCGPDFSGLHLRIAAGNPGGVYDNLAQTLATAWAAELGIERPQVLQTGGTPDNLMQIKSGEADVAFVAADVAAAQSSGLAALARIHDDYLHLVVRSDSTINAVAQLAGKRVSTGSTESGVEYIAQELLGVAGLKVDRRSLNLQQSLLALEAGEIDAFFWSGGLPTPLITDFNTRVGLRLLDIGALMPQMQALSSVYGTATIPASTYNQHEPVTTLVVPNFLVVRTSMPDDVAEALTRGLFDARPQLAQANPAALSIDIHPGIETQPIPLHPGAMRYYRSQKT